MSEPRLIIFDCDGTLVDSGHIVVRAMSAAMDAVGRPPPDEAAVRREIGLSLQTAIANAAPGASDAEMAALLEAFRQDYHAAMVSPDTNEPLYDGCRGVLDSLSDQPNYILGIATGKGRNGLGHTLNRHDIAGYFSVLKTAEDGPGKPSPDILLDAIAETGVTPWNTVVIGDTIFDTGMAVRAGAHAIGVSWGYHAPEELLKAGARDVAERFADIPEMLNDLWRTV